MKMDFVFMMVWSVPINHVQSRH